MVLLQGGLRRPCQRLALRGEGGCQVTGCEGGNGSEDMSGDSKGHPLFQGVWWEEEQKTEVAARGDQCGGNRKLH